MSSESGLPVQEAVSSRGSGRTHRSSEQPRETIPGPGWSVHPGVRAQGRRACTCALRGSSVPPLKSLADVSRGHHSRVQGRGSWITAQRAPSPSPPAALTPTTLMPQAHGSHIHSPSRPPSATWGEGREGHPGDRANGAVPTTSHSQRAHSIQSRAERRC